MAKGFVVTAIVLLVAFLLWPVADRLRWVATGFAAKTMCSGVFVSRLPYDTLMNNDLNTIGGFPKLMTTAVNHGTKTVSVSLLGATSMARYHGPDLGCSLDDGDIDIHSEMTKIKFAKRKLYPWPEAKSTSQEKVASVDYKTLENTIKSEFEIINKETLTEAEIIVESERIRAAQTRAIVVIHKGKLVAEGYANNLNISQNTPLIGWSMTKSLLATVTGLLIHQGRLSLDDIANVPEWEDDKRKQHGVTIRNTLNANTGIDFAEKYHPVSDVCKMIFTQSDTAGFAAEFPLSEAPGNHWAYSSATSNLLARVVRGVFKTDEEYWRFPREHLFDTIGAASMVMETDPSGTFVGSSYSYATARDWAKLGQLHLQNGVWEGKQILPPYWVKFITTAVPTSGGNYGGHWWLNPYAVPERERITDPGGFDKGYTSVLPLDSYRAEGHEGQYVIVIPSKDLVIVRLGMSRGRKTSDKAQFFSKIVNCFN